MISVRCTVRSVATQLAADQRDVCCEFNRREELSMVYRSQQATKFVIGCGLVLAATVAGGLIGNPRCIGGRCSSGIYPRFF